MNAGLVTHYVSGSAQRAIFIILFYYLTEGKGRVKLTRHSTLIGRPLCLEFHHVLTLLIVNKKGQWDSKFTFVYTVVYWARIQGGDELSAPAGSGIGWRKTVQGKM